MRAFYVFLFLLFFAPCSLWGYGSSGSEGERDSLLMPRFRGVLIGKAVGTGGIYLGLEEAWYSQYGRGRFHFFDDSDEWLQMDKAGHFWAAHHLSRWSSSLWKWSGMKKDRAALWGSGVGIFFLSGVEVLDGFSTGWGFSWSDAGSNFLGAASFLLQERAWGETYITPAFSYSPSPYASYRPRLLGASHWERVLKDYNGQAYWLDFDPELVGGTGFWPEWLALSVGYGASGMLGGSQNPSINAAGGSLPDFSRHRRYFLSLDLLFEELPVQGKGWRTLFKLLDGFKVPFPTLEFAPEKGVRGHWLAP